jgi:hypothetical protein
VTQNGTKAGTVLATAGETLRWTHCMQLNGGTVMFEVCNGQSTTWGAFGGNGQLRTHAPTSLPNLNSYNPAVSVEHSAAVFADNRVHSLVLKRIRLVMKSGDEFEFELNQSVH